MHRVLLSVAVLLAACGDNLAGSVNGPPPPPSTKDHQYYVVDHLDLGFDGTADTPPSDPVNYLFALIGELGIDPQLAINHALDTGATSNLIDFLPGEDDANAAWVQTFTATGSDPAACSGAADTTCRHQFDGGATFTALRPRGAARGPAVAPDWLGQDGRLEIQLPVFGDTAADVRLLNAKIGGDFTVAAPKNITVSGAIAADDFDQHLLPALAANLTAVAANDCTVTDKTCGCTDNSVGLTVLNTFDADQDCAVTADELRSNVLLQSIATNVDIGKTTHAYSVTFTVDTIAAKPKFEN